MVTSVSRAAFVVAALLVLFVPGVRAQSSWAIAERGIEWSDLSVSEAVLVDGRPTSIKFSVKSRAPVATVPEEPGTPRDALRPWPEALQGPGLSPREATLLPETALVHDGRLLQLRAPSIAAGADEGASSPEEHRTSALVVPTRRLVDAVTVRNAARDLRGGVDDINIYLKKVETLSEAVDRTESASLFHWEEFPLE